MGSPHRRIAAVGAVLAAAALLAAPAGGFAAPGDTMLLTGTLLVSPAESPDQEPSYAVQTDDGALVPIAGDLGRDRAGGPAAEPIPGSRFRGRVAADALSALLAHRGPTRPLAVADVTVTEAAAAAAPPVTHRWFLAVPENFAGPGMTDAALLTRLGWVADYWTAQAEGTIAGIDVPAALTRYPATATSEAAGCGLSGSDFWSTVAEAAAQFPGANFGGTDQLLVLVPTSCLSGGVVGRASVGSVSFAMGGYSISKTGSGYFETTVAHELGHNYGFGHAALGPCSPGCASEYGDYYSVMGAAINGKPLPPVLGTVSRRQQGVLEPGEVETISGGDEAVSVTRTLQSRSSATGLRSLAVVDATSGTTLQVDFRSGTGADADAYYATGSSVGAYRPGVVVETTRGSNAMALLPGPSSRKAMVAGDTLTVGDVTIEVTALTASTATVSVTIPGGLPAYPTPGSVALATGPQVGRSVSATLSGWTPAPTSVDYVWLADGTPIAGAGAASYTPGPGLAGRQLSVRVTGSVAGHQSASATSTPQLVGLGELHSSRPTIAGRAKVGRTLRARPGEWTPGTALSFRWFAGGVRLRQVHGPRLVLAPRLEGRRVKVVVVGKLDGYATATRTSTPTHRVRGA